MHGLAFGLILVTCEAGRGICLRIKRNWMLHCENPSGTNDDDEKIYQGVERTTEPRSRFERFQGHSDLPPKQSLCTNLAFILRACGLPKAFVSFWKEIRWPPDLCW